MTEDQLLALLLSDEDRIRRIVSQLHEEGLIDNSDGSIRIMR
jgi:transcription initiation factor IIE alpha subunit